MGDLINSICFHENSLSLIQVTVNSGQSVTVKRVVESPLPFIINYDNIQKMTTALPIANHLRSLADANELNMQNVRFLLSAKFGIIKKIQIDPYIPKKAYPQIVKNELKYVLTAAIDEYMIYQPEYIREHNAIREILVVAIRKELLDFIQQIGVEAKFSLTQINLNCFSIDELFRRFFPNLIGQTLLINFTERGYEIIISDEKNFINFNFCPYSKALQSIDHLDENDIISAFSSLVKTIQHPAAAETPLYAVSQIFLFGSHFRHDWLDKLQSQSTIPLRILNPIDTTEWHIISEDRNFDSIGAYRYVEPLSSIF